jgi:ATP-binding cassette subfamily B protein
MSSASLSYTSLLGRYMRPFTGRFILLAFVLIGSIAAQLASPQTLRAFIDSTQTGGAANTPWQAALAFIALAAAQRLLALATSYLGSDLGWRATNRLRSDLTRHTLRLDMGFHKLHTPGELIDRIDGDCDALGNFFSQFSLSLASNALLALGILALLFREDWRIGLGLSLYAGLTLAALFGLQRISVTHWAAKREADTAMLSFVEERMAAAEDLRSSGAEQHALDRLVALAGRMLLTRRSAEMISHLAFGATNFLFLVGYAVGLAVGATLYLEGAVTIGTAFLIVFYIGMLSDPLETIRNQVQDLQQAGASIGRIGALLAEQPRLADRATRSLPAGPLDVRFEGVSFTYADDGRWTMDQSQLPANDTIPSIDNVQPVNQMHRNPWPVLTNITLSLGAGQVLGLLGRTGSGKTTLARLVARLYDVDAGSVSLGGVNVHEVALAELRGRVGVVTQDVQIFQASIRENLTLFRPEVTDKAIEQALGELGLLEWVRGLKDGLDTALGPGGLGLSAGEAQLLAFARVFLRDPGLVILDEASSRLDPATERLLERAIGRLLRNRTAIIIAHRLTTVQRADCILILEGGRVLEHGPRTALAADPASRFATLLRVGLEEVLA